MKNWQKWALTLALGFGGGVIGVATDTQDHPAKDYVRQGLLGLAPAVAALKMTLNNDAAQ